MKIINNRNSKRYKKKVNFPKTMLLLAISDRNQIRSDCLSIADQFSVPSNITVNIDQVIFWHINVYIQSVECRAA